MTNVADVQTEINEALGVSSAVNDLNGDGTVNVADVQIVINAALAVDPLDRFVFVANKGSNSVSVFQLNSSTGGLTAVPGSPFPADAMPSALAVDPAGQVLLVADAASGKVSAFDVLFTGALRSNAGPFAAGTSPVAVAIDASGHYAFRDRTTFRSFPSCLTSRAPVSVEGRRCSPSEHSACPPALRFRAPWRSIRPADSSTWREAPRPHPAPSPRIPSTPPAGI